MSGRNLNKKYTSDNQMLLLIDLLKSYGKIKFQNDFCEATGVLKQNLNNIKNGDNHFTPEHIEKAVKTYNINANWIFGVSDQIFLGNKNGHTTIKKSTNLEHDD